MTIPLRQSTASQEIPLGYFLDSTNGNTEETGLTIANTDIKLWKMGTTTLANKNSGGATHISNGIYYCVLDATDSNTLGSLIIFVHVAGALAVRVECEVMTANRYDSLVTGTDRLYVDVMEISNDSTAASNLEKDYDGTGYAKTNSTIGTCTTNTDMVGTDNAALAATALTDVTWTDAKAGHLDAPISTVDTVVDGIQTDLSNATDGLGALKALIDTIDGVVDTILADTNELQTNQGNWLTATGFSTHSAANVWAVAARTLTANTNFNDLDAAAIKAEVVAALADIKLDHLINIAVDTNWATTVHLDSVIGHLADVGTAATFNRTTDAQEAIRDRGDAEWITATGFNTVVPDAAGVAPTVTEIRQEMDTNSTKMAPSQVLNDYKATGFNTVVPDAAGVAPTAAEIKTEVEQAGSSIAQILADTDNLQTNQGNWLTATGFSTHNAAAVWSVAARVLTANTNFNDLTAAEVKAEVAAALQDIKLDHLINSAVDTNWATTVHLDSVVGHMADVGTAATFNRTTDALEAIRNRGDGAWITATGFNTTTPPTVVQIRQEMDTNSTKMAPSQVLNDYKATGFNTVVPDAAGIAAGLHTTTDGLITTVDTVADGIQTDLSNATDGLGALKTLIDTIDGVVDAILVDTGTTLNDMVERILGISQENFYIDTTVFTGANMTSCRIRLYSVAGSVGTASDVIATYNMTTTYAGDNLASYKMVKA